MRRCIPAMSAGAPPRYGRLMAGLPCKPRNRAPLSPRNLPRRFPARRGSAFVFVACLGIWLPKSHGGVLVDLDATALSEGALTTWTNKGTVAGDFTSAGDTVPSVATVDGVKSVRFLGGTGGDVGTHY